MATGNRARRKTDAISSNLRIAQSPGVGYYMAHQMMRDENKFDLYNDFKIDRFPTFTKESLYEVCQSVYSGIGKWKSAAGEQSFEGMTTLRFFLSLAD